MLKYAFAEITKFEETPDGDLMVEGLAASPSLDLDKQRMSADFLKGAMPSWAEWSNVRAMHGNVAAGVGAELSESKPGHWILKALIVDEDAKNKVRKKVYKGFSVGIKHPLLRKHASAPNGLIVGGEIVEISLVDRPANPDSFISICKSAGGSIMLPVDSQGREISVDTFTGQWLSADLHKSALATAHDVLDGVDYDAESASEAIDQLSDLFIAEAMTLKSADLSGPVDITSLQTAYEALMTFVDTDESGYAGGAPQMQRDMDSYLGKSATLVRADLVKAVTEATRPLLERIETLTADIAEVKSKPIPGGPVTTVRTPQPVQASLTKSAQLMTQALKPSYAPDIQKLLAEHAGMLED